MSAESDFVQPGPTAGEIGTGENFKGAAVALALPQDVAGDVAVSLVSDLTQAAAAVAAAMETFCVPFWMAGEGPGPREFLGWA